MRTFSFPRVFAWAALMGITTCVGPAQTRPMAETAEHPADWINHAAGKPVSGQDGASHGKGLARHVTDGDPATHAKPPASHFAYEIQLAAEPADAVSVDCIHVDWGEFGDRFHGVPDGKGGWAAAAWPGEYVTAYLVEARLAGADGWQRVHAWNGRPAQETGDGIRVTLTDSTRAGTSSRVYTELRGLALSRVTHLRISGQGQHWIGLYELEAWGPRH